MKLRKKLGNCNVVGARVTKRRHLLNIKQKDLLAMIQSDGMAISTSGLSELEGQNRIVRDFEVQILAKRLKTTVEYLIDGRNEDLEQK